MAEQENIQSLGAEIDEAPKNESIFDYATRLIEESKSKLQNAQASPINQAQASEVSGNDMQPQVGQDNATQATAEAKTSNTSSNTSDNNASVGNQNANTSGSEFGTTNLYSTSIPLGGNNSANTTTSAKSNNSQPQDPSDLYNKDLQFHIKSLPIYEATEYLQNAYKQYSDDVQNGKIKTDEESSRIFNDLIKPAQELLNNRYQNDDKEWSNRKYDPAQISDEELSLFSDEERSVLRNGDYADAKAKYEEIAKQYEEIAKDDNASAMDKQKAHDKYYMAYDIVTAKGNQIKEAAKQQEAIQQQEAKRKHAEAEAKWKKDHAKEIQAAEDAKIVSDWTKKHASKEENNTVGVSEGFRLGANDASGKTPEQANAQMRNYIEQNEGKLSNAAINDYVTGAVTGYNLRKEYGDDKLNWQLEPIDSMVLQNDQITKGVKEEFIKIRKGEYRGKRGDTYQDILYGATDEFVKKFEKKYKELQDKAENEVNKEHREASKLADIEDANNLGLHFAMKRLTALDIEPLIQEALKSIPEDRMEALVLAVSKNTNYDTNKASDLVSQEFAKACLSRVELTPNSDTEAILSSAIFNSIAGNIYAIGARGDGKKLTALDVYKQNIAKQMEDWGKEGLGGYAKIATGAALSFAADIPVFSGIGKAVGYLTKSGLSRLLMTALPKIERSSEVGAQMFRGFSMTKTGRAVIGVTSGSLTGAIYSPLSYTTGTLASGQDWSFDEMMVSAMRGGLEFGGMAAMAPIMNIGAEKILNKVTGTGKLATATRLATNITFKDLLTPGANAAFCTGLAYSSGEIHESLGTYFAKKFGEFFGMHAMGKIQAGKQGLREYRVSTSLNASAFTPAELQAMGFKTTKGLTIALIHGGEEGQDVFVGKDTVNVKGRVDKDFVQNLLNNPEVPWTAKAKVLTILAGDGSAIATPTITQVRIEDGTDAKGKPTKVVKTYAVDGTFVSESEAFTDMKAAANEAGRLNEIAYKNSVAIEEAHKDAKWAELSQGVARKRVTKEFGDGKVSEEDMGALIDRALEKSNKGEELTETEQKVLDAYAKALMNEISSQTADNSRNARKEFSEAEGVDLDKILSKKYYDWTTEEREAVDRYLDYLNGEYELPKRESEPLGGEVPPSGEVPPKDDNNNPPAEEINVEGEDKPQEPTTPTEPENGEDGNPPVPPVDDKEPTKDDMLNEVGIEDYIKLSKFDEETAEEIRDDAASYEKEINAVRENAGRAIDYANGEIDEKPNDWDYWAEKFGLQEPTPVDVEPTREELINGVGVEDYIATEGVEGDKEFADEVRNNPDAFADEVKALQEDAALAFDYADGTTTDKPKNWDYWRDKFGLKEPEPKEPKDKEPKDGEGNPPEGDDGNDDTPEVVDGNPPAEGNGNPPKGKGKDKVGKDGEDGDDGNPPIPPKPKRPKVSDTDPKDMSDEDLAKELATLQEYQDKVPEDFGDDLDTRKKAIEDEQKRRIPKPEPKFKKGDELIAEHNGRHFTIVVDSVTKDGEIRKSHVKSTGNDYHKNGKVVYEETPEERISFISSEDYFDIQMQSTSQEKRKEAPNQGEGVSVGASNGVEPENREQQLDNLLNSALKELDEFYAAEKAPAKKNAILEAKANLVANFVNRIGGLNKSYKALITIKRSSSEMTKACSAMAPLSERQRKRVVGVTLDDGRILINSNSSGVKSAKDIRDAVTHETTHAYNIGDGAKVVEEIANKYTVDELLSFIEELAGKNVAGEYRKIYSTDSAISEAEKRLALADEITAFYSQFAREGKPKVTSDDNLNNILKQHNDDYTNHIKDRSKVPGEPIGGGNGSDGKIHEGTPGNGNDGSVRGVGFGRQRRGRDISKRRSEEHRRRIAELDKRFPDKSPSEVLDELGDKDRLTRDDCELAAAYAEAKTAEQKAKLSELEKEAKGKEVTEERAKELQEEIADTKEEIEAIDASNKEIQNRYKEQKAKDKEDAKEALGAIEEDLGKTVGAKARKAIENIAKSLGLSVKLYNGRKSEVGKIEGDVLYLNENRLADAEHFAIGAGVVAKMSDANVQHLSEMLFGSGVHDKSAVAEYIGNNILKGTTKDNRKWGREALLDSVLNIGESREFLTEFRDAIKTVLETIDEKKKNGKDSLYSKALSGVEKRINALLAEKTSVKPTVKDTEKSYSEQFGEKPKRKITEKVAKFIAPLLEQFADIKKAFDKWSKTNKPQERKAKAKKGKEKESLDERYKKRLEGLEGNKKEYERDVAVLQKQIDDLKKGVQQDGDVDADGVASRIAGKQSELKTKQRLLESTNKQIEDAPEWYEKQKKLEEERELREAAKQDAMAAAMADFEAEDGGFEDGGLADAFSSVFGDKNKKAEKYRRQKADTDKALGELREVIDDAIEGGDDSNSLLDSARRSVSNNAARGARFLLAGEVGAKNLEKATGDDTVRKLFEEAKKVDGEKDMVKRFRLISGLRKNLVRKFADFWTYEFDDVKFKGRSKDEEGTFKGFKDKLSKAYRGNKTLTLGDVLDNDLLYKLYPTLKTMEIEFNPNINGDEYGYYDKNNNKISISFSRKEVHKLANGKNKEKTITLSELEIRRTLAHEIQHAIQFIENWPIGGDTNSKEVVDFTKANVKKCLSIATAIVKDADFLDYYKKYKKSTKLISDKEDGAATFVVNYLIDKYGRGSEEVHNQNLIEDAINILIRTGVASFDIKSNKVVVDEEALDVYGEAHDLSAKDSRAGMNSPLFEEVVGKVKENAVLDSENLKKAPAYWVYDDNAKSSVTGSKTLHNDFAFLGYTSLRGEVQARVVQQRVGWTQEQRRIYGLEQNEEKISIEDDKIPDREDRYIPDEDQIVIYEKDKDDDNDSFSKPQRRGVRFSIAGAQQGYDAKHTEIDDAVKLKLPKDATVDDINAEIERLKQLRADASKEYLSGQPHSEEAKEDFSRLRAKIKELNAAKAKMQEATRKQELNDKLSQLTSDYISAKWAKDMDKAKEVAKKMTQVKKEIDASSTRGKFKAKIAEIKANYENVSDIAKSVTKYIKSELEPELAKEMGKAEFNSLMQSLREVADAGNQSEGTEENKRNITNTLDDAIRKIDDTIVTIDTRKAISDIVRMLNIKTTKRDASGRKVGVRVDNNTRVALDIMRSYLDGLNPKSEVAKMLKPIIDEIDAKVGEAGRTRKEAKEIAKERVSLEEQLQNGDISQDEYDKKIAELDQRQSEANAKSQKLDKEFELAVSQFGDDIDDLMPRSSEEFNKLEQDLAQKWLDEQAGMGEMTAHEKAMYNALPFVREMIDTIEQMHEVEKAKNRVALLEKAYKRDTPNPADSEAEAAERKDRRVQTAIQLAEAKANLAAQKVDARTALRDFTSSLKSMIDFGKTILTDEQSRRNDRKKEVVRIGIQAVDTGKGFKEGVERQQETEKAEAKADSLLKRFWNFLFLRPTESAESMLSRVDVNHFSTEGDLYKRLMLSERGFSQSQSRLITSKEGLREEIRNKCKEIFGKKKPTGRGDKITFTQTFTLTEIDEATGAEITTTHRQDGTVTKGVALSIYLYSLSEKGREKLDKQGIDANAISQIKAGLGKDWIDFGDWIVKDFLPKLYEKYNEKYIELYGTELTQNENYFPWRIYQGDVVTKDDLEAFDNGNGVPLPSALKERTQHSYELSTTDDALNILNDHIESMEDWYHFADMREDISNLLSSRMFRNLLSQQSPNKFTRFRDAMHVMAGMRVGEENVTSQVLNEFQRGMATSAIAFRFWTALKQLQSILAGYNYSYNPKFTMRLIANTFSPFGMSLLSGKFKNTENMCAGMLGSCYWAWKNSPQFRERLLSGSMGNAMLEYESSLSNGRGRSAKYYRNLRNVISTLGMAPNRAFDAIAVAVYSKSIYDYTYRRLIKKGTPPEEAHQIALTVAENNYNKTQQSSQLAYMSAMQASSNSVEKGVTTFQTASLGFARKTINHINDMRRAFRLMRLGKEEPLHALGKGCKATVDTLWDGFVMPASWNLLNVVGLGGFYAGTKAIFNAVFGDDDDKKKGLPKDANGKTALDRFIEDKGDDVAFATITAPLQGTVLNNLLNTWWAGRNNWSPTMGEGAINDILRAVNNITDAWKNNGQSMSEDMEDIDEDAAKYTAGVFINAIVRGTTGIDLNTIKRLYNAFVDRKVEGKLNPFDNFVSGSHFLSTPMSNLTGSEAREYYLGGYGKNSETATSLEDYIAKRAYADGKIFVKDAVGKGELVKLMRTTAFKRDLNKYVDEWAAYHLQDAVAASDYHQEWLNNKERVAIRRQNARLEISDETAKQKEDSLKLALGYDQKKGNSEQQLRFNLVNAILGKIKKKLTGSDKERKQAFDAMRKLEQINTKQNRTHSDYVALAKEMGVQDWTMIPKEVTSSGKYVNSSDIENGTIGVDEVKGAYNLYATKEDNFADVEFDKIRKRSQGAMTKAKAICKSYAQGGIDYNDAYNQLIALGDELSSGIATKMVGDEISKIKSALSKALKEKNFTTVNKALEAIRKLRSKVIEKKYKGKEEIAKYLLSVSK